MNLRVLEGPRAGEVFPLDRSIRTVVGRSRTAVIRIDSPGLSREHFEIWWDGAAWRVRDLESRNGLLVNRRPVRDEELQPGDEIQAGDTRYQIEVPTTGRRRFVEEAPATSDAPAASVPPTAGTVGDEAGTLILPLPVYDHVDPTLSADVPPAKPGTLLAALIDACTHVKNERVFALIDGAQAFELAFTARLMGNRLYTLFVGKLAVDLAHVGPCLVDVTRPDAMLAKWLDAIGTHAGVLFTTAADLNTVYRHLRHLFIATDENGREYFFRFYDPRVLRAYLPTCRAEELSEFFGPTSSWVVEAPGAREYAAYARTPDGRLDATRITGL